MIGRLIHTVRGHCELTPPCCWRRNGLIRGECCREHVDTQRLLQYVVRILGSRMAPSVVGDEQHLSQVIQKKRDTHHSHPQHTDPAVCLAVVRGATATDAAKFADLHRRLTQMPVLRERWSIIYLLMT